MDLQFKTFPFEIKAASGDGSSFEGLVSVFHNIDSYGEIVDDGAFSQDLERFLADGFIGGLNHDWDNPIGTPQPGTKVTPRGLFLKANVIDTSHGLDVRKMLQAGVVKKLSIGYSTLGAEMLETPEEVMAYWEGKGYTPSAQDMARAMRGMVRVLTRVRAYEGSPVTVPANDLATITAVKAAQAKALLCDLTAETPGTEETPAADEQAGVPDGTPQDTVEQPPAGKVVGKASVPTDARGIEEFLRDAGGFSQSVAKVIISNVKALPRDAESEPDAASEPLPDAATPPDEVPDRAARPMPPADETPAPPADAPSLVKAPLASVSLLTDADVPEPDELVRLRNGRWLEARARALALCGTGANQP